MIGRAARLIPQDLGVITGGILLFSFRFNYFDLLLMSELDGALIC